MPDRLARAVRRPAPFARDECIIRKNLLPAFGKKILDEITSWDIERYKNRRLRFLAPDEARLLIESCAPHLRTIVIVALNTGLRRGEIFNLKWGDVDLEHGQLTVRDSKNGESRTVELNQQVVETLSQLKGRSKNLLVFPSRHGEPYNDIRDSFYAA